MEPAQLERLRDSMPFAVSLGLQITAAGKDEVSGTLDWAEAVTTAGGALHGGALMALADSLGGVCAFLNLPAGRGRHVDDQFQHRVHARRPRRDGHGHRQAAAHRPLDDRCADRDPRRGRAAGRPGHPDPGGPERRLEDRLGPVVRGARLGGQHGVDRRDDGRHLRAGRAGERQRLDEQRRRARPRTGPAASRAASRSNRSLRSVPFSRISSATATAFSLIASCAASRPWPGAHGGHQHLGRREERQVAVEFALDHRRERAELVEHGQRRLEQAVDREERVGQRDPAHDRARDVALVPLVAGQLARSSTR